MDVGEKIKNLRLQMGLTQEELAERSDLTKGFISQVENGFSSPSVETMHNLLVALGTNMSDFFEEEKTEPVVYSFEDAFNASYDKLGLVVHWIVPNAQKNAMEPVIFDLEPGSKSKVYNPFEGEAFGYVLEGEIILSLGQEKYEVKQGDCFYFEVDRQYHVENPNKKKARLLWVLTPPNF